MSMSTASSSTRQPEIIELNDNQYMSLDPSNPFCFTVPGRVLKRAIAGLADEHFNPSNLAMMEVCRDGFEITVSHVDKEHGEVFALLSLKTSRLTDSVCRKPMVKMLKLELIDEFLRLNARDVDVIKVYNVEGFDTLCFTFEKPVLGLVRRFFYEADFIKVPIFTQFPIIGYGFEIDIPANKIEPVIDSILGQNPCRRPPLVSVTIDTTLAVKTGSILNSYEVVKTDEQKSVLVCFPYYEALKKTIRLADSCTLWLASRPENSVILKFDLQGLGQFVYFKYAAEFSVTKEFPTMGTFRPLFPRMI